MCLLTLLLHKMTDDAPPTSVKSNRLLHWRPITNILSLPSTVAASKARIGKKFIICVVSAALLEG